MAENDEPPSGTKVPPAKKMCSEESKDKDNEVSFVPREYQIEILEAAKKQNTIACLGTGTGKTFIAVMLIREMGHIARVPFEEGGKKIFFLVPTVPLVQQQADVIEKHTELKIGRYFGEMNVDAWSTDEWLEEFKKYHVLVMTAEICRIILDHSFIHVSKICLLIVDECHRAQGKHPYREIMKNIFSVGNQQEVPRIFGLSASLLNSKCNPVKLQDRLRDLEITLQSKIVTASDYNDVQKYGTDPGEVLVMYEENERIIDQHYTAAVMKINNQLSDVHDSLQSVLSRYCENDEISGGDENIHFFRKPKRCLQQLCNILKYFGPWCTVCAAEVFLGEVEQMLNRTDESEKSHLLRILKEKLESVIGICKQYRYDYFENSMNVRGNKLQRLLDIFTAVREFIETQVQELHAAAAASGTAPAFTADPLGYWEHLKDKKQGDASLSSSVCGIVFVEQRIFAYVLCKWLEEFIKHNKEFDFLKPKFIVGHGCMGSESARSSMSVHRQKEVVKDFRDKKCNLLISTSVLEEGMDVQKCNIVIRFDLPKDFRSYVQSKGRARAKGSKYVILLSDAEYRAFTDDLCNFKTIEELLIKKRNDTQTPSKEETEKSLCDDLLPPYMPVTKEGSPRITLSSSVGILYRYCSLLPSDMATRLLPRWKVEVVDPDSVKKEYICEVQLPINCPLREVITGEKMKRKKLAKMAAALKACEKLHQIGELNDNLLPFSNAVDIAIEQLQGCRTEEQTAEGEGQPGTNRRRQFYKRGVAKCLQNGALAAGQPCYLHLFVLDLVCPLAKSLNPRGRPIVDPSAVTNGFGLLCKKKLPVICRFPIFTKVGKIMTGIKCLDQPLILDEIKIKAVQDFHRFVFADTLVLEKKDFEFAPSASDCSYYIVPVDICSGLECIDWDIITYTLQHGYNEEKLKCMKEVKREKFEEHSFLQAVVTRSYMIDTWAVTKRVFHFVNHICYDLNPLSRNCFEGSKFLDFKEYYKDKYNVSVLDDKQPLLDVERCPSLNMTKPIYVSVQSESKSKSRHEHFREYLIPELCILHPFKSQIFRKASYIPSIMYRANHLLLAEELREKVAEETHAGQVSLPSNFRWPDFNFEQSDRKLKEILISRGEIPSEVTENSVPCADILKSAENEIISFEVSIDVRNHTGPNPSLLLQALTTTSANDEFDLERLEMIGDSFLKYAISVKLYSDFPKFDEGKLTKLRMQLIRNLNLYQLSRKKKLPECLVHRPCDCNNFWLPPCYRIRENISVTAQSLVELRKDSEGECDKKDAATNNVLWSVYQLISDKCVADSVEALIGAYLLSCGYKGALRFMHWLGVSAYSEKDKQSGSLDFDAWPPKPNDPVIEDYADHNDRPQCVGKFRLLLGFEEFEKRIGYKFKEPAYLLQAFTHASYLDNQITDCYQRLEFLGDAVLDYLVTRKLYDDPKEHTPGELTDLRAALVNNIFFASLAVKYGYHKNLKMLSPTLFKQITYYIQLLEDSQAFQSFKEYGYYLEEIECFGLEEVEVPKALGDIFESVAGAIYLDSGMSLDAVWKVYYPMMKPSIDHLCEHVPKSPVRELIELVNDPKVFCVDQCVEKGEKTYVYVKLPTGEEFVGIGPNKKVAKRSAAKRAVAFSRKYASK